jgi:hypothetical protein
MVQDERNGSQEMKMTKPDRNPTSSSSPPVTTTTKATKATKATTTSLKQPTMSENVRKLAAEDPKYC